MELSGIRSVTDADLGGRTVFVRVDFNVPMKDGTITDDARIRAALPTIEHLRSQGARIVLASHLGRPKNGPDPAFSMLPVAARLAELLDAEVVAPDDCVGHAVERLARDLPEGGVMLLENVRFHEGEKKGDKVFASALAEVADAYVNDAFGAAHRADASTYTMVQFFPEDRRFAGLLIDRELRHLAPLLHNPERPYVGILGGAKVSDKLRVIENLIGRLDALLIGGAMAYTFLAARGVNVGKSLVEHDMFEAARQLMSSAETRKTRLVLPVDHVVAASIDADSGTITPGESIPDGLAGFDIGPGSIERFTREIRGAATVFWNGPVGVFERPPFETGTRAVAQALADVDAFVVVGGGDSASALARFELVDAVTHVSTGGGASLEFIEGRDLPGIAALRAGHRFKS
jgi:phosphoglycerate kinase